MWKLFTFLLCVAVVCMNVIAIQYKIDEPVGPVEYEFHYSVNDPHTGDIKSQKETRKDDKVEGSYELIDSDGYRRVVTYKADDKNGFVAVVVREPTDIKIPLPEPQKKIVTTKLLAPAPLGHYSPKLDFH